MTSINQSEGSSQPIEKQVEKAPFQLKAQSRDSSNAKQEKPVTALTPVGNQPVASSSPDNYPSNNNSLLKPQKSTLMTIATELRLKIYLCLFQAPNTHLLRRRTAIDDEKVIEKLAHTFNNSILFTCRKLYQEVLPIFYASQTFHHSSTTGGLSRIGIRNPEKPWANDERVRQGATPFFSKNLHLMVHLSMDLEVIDSKNTDAGLSNQITEFAQHCPQLRTLTIHLLRDKWRVQDFPVNSATGSALRQLRPRLDNLSIIVLGSRPHKVLPKLRLSIADKKDWSGECWTGTMWSEQCWLGERCAGFRTSAFALKWPYLTLPSLIQRHVDIACTKTEYFGSRTDNDDYIYKWTCSREVGKDIGSRFHSPFE